MNGPRQILYWNFYQVWRNVVFVHTQHWSTTRIVLWHNFPRPSFVPENPGTRTPEVLSEVLKRGCLACEECRRAFGGTLIEFQAKTQVKHLNPCCLALGNQTRSLSSCLDGHNKGSRINPPSDNIYNGATWERTWRRALLNCNLHQTVMALMSWRKRKADKSIFFFFCSRIWTQYECKCSLDWHSDEAERGTEERKHTKHTTERQQIISLPATLSLAVRLLIVPRFSMVATHW